VIGKELRAAGAAAALLVLLASCATVVGGTSQDIAVDTDPQGASCAFTRGNEGALGTVAQTPGKFAVQRRKEALQITCSRDGYAPTTEIVESKFSGATVGNALFGGLIGIAVDAASGANNDYPERIIIVMTPGSFPDAAARDEHFTKVAERIKESTAKEIKTIQGRCTSTQRELCQIDVKRIEDARDRALAGIEQKKAVAKVATAVSSR